MTGSVSRLENAIDNVHTQTLEYVRKRSEYWNQFFDKGYHTNGNNDDTIYYVLPENADQITAENGLQLWDPEANPGASRPYNSVVVDNENGIDQASSLLTAQFYNGFGSDVMTALAQQGVSNTGISEYNARVTANYSFKEGRLKGFSMGTNLRWESGKALGYEIVRVDDADLPEAFPDADSDGDGLIGADEYLVTRSDKDNPIKGDAHVTGGIMFNYKTKIMDDKVNWRIQLNVDNLFRQGDDFRITRFNADYTPVYGLNRPTTYKLTNSFDF